MNDLDPQVSPEQFPEVFALAARLQAQQQQHYSLSELTQIGAEANIQPEFIRQAVRQIQAKQTQTRQWQQGLKAGLIGLSVVIGFGALSASRVPFLSGHCGSMMQAKFHHHEPRS
jgi:hypothetical protein